MRKLDIENDKRQKTVKSRIDRSPGAMEQKTHTGYVNEVEKRFTGKLVFTENIPSKREREREREREEGIAKRTKATPLSGERKRRPKEESGAVGHLSRGSGELTRVSGRPWQFLLSGLSLGKGSGGSFRRPCKLGDK